MEEKILEFVKRRFPVDQDWTTGNCYFFALILQSVFGGDIMYDVVKGHFLLKLNNELYDWTGKVEEYGCIIKWEEFMEYDSLQYERIIKDCIK